MNVNLDRTPFQAANQYLVRERIAAGGMGTVYRAYDIRLRRDVALKVLNRLDPDALERFEREREITADLDHPNFVRILSTGYLATDEGQRPFYTMPLLRGITLAELIRRRSKSDAEGSRLRDEYSFTRLLQFVQQICLALESAHARGIIHGDLKPTNVIVGTYGELYIVDLGLARYVREAEAEADPADADTVHPAGTPFYTAPEAILDPGRADPRSDIFGVGAIFYFLLTGMPPRYRSATAEPEGGGPRLIGEPPADSTIDARPPEDSPLVRPGDRFPQWHEPDAAGSEASSRAVLESMLHGTLVPPDQVLGRAAAEVVDPAITSICLKALTRTPADRYATIRDMWQEIQLYLEGQVERILAREASDLSRAPTRRTVPMALRTYELAEQGLRERIVEKERSGRFGLEEKLDLFDLMIDKARTCERRGDTDSMIRSALRAEPILDTALEVLQQQRVQLLVARGTAMVDQGDFAGAKPVLAEAVKRARAEHLDDLLAAAHRAFGRACVGLGRPADLAAGRRAVEKSVELADAAQDAAARVRGRLALAKILQGGRPRIREARKILGEALAQSGADPVLLCETHLALGAFHLGRREPAVALHQIETGLQHAREIDARNLVQESHFLLGCAYHDLGDAPERRKHFRLSVMVRGLRRTDMEKRLAAFYSARNLDPTEIGLGSAPAKAPEAPARRRARTRSSPTFR